MKKQIVEIQARREDQALKEFLEKKQRYEQLKAEYDQLKQRLTDYQAWRKSETERVFEEMKQAPVSKKELDKIKEKLAEYKFEELALTEEEMKVSMQVKTYEEDKERAYAGYQHSRVKKSKFETVYKQTKTRAERKQNRKEENEIDEDMILNFGFEHE